MVSFPRRTAIENKTKPGMGEGKELGPRNDFNAVSLPKAGEGGSGCLSNPRRWPSQWPGCATGVMGLRLTALSVSTPLERTALGTAVPTDFVASQWVAEESKVVSNKVYWANADLPSARWRRFKIGSSTLQSRDFSCPESLTINLKMFSKLSSKWKYLFKSSVCNKKISF